MYTAVGKDMGPFQLTLDENNSIVVLDGNEEQIWSSEAPTEGSKYTKIALQNDGTIWVVDTYADDTDTELASVFCVGGICDDTDTDDTDTVLWSTRAGLQFNWFICCPNFGPSFGLTCNF